MVLIIYLNHCEKYCTAFCPSRNDRQNIFLQLCKRSECIIYFLFNRTKLKVNNLNGRFRWLEQGRTTERFCSGKLIICNEKLFAELIEFFVGYEMANLVF
jgi:hypothetical protein